MVRDNEVDTMPLEDSFLFFRGNAIIDRDDKIKLSFRIFAICV